MLSTQRPFLTGMTCYTIFCTIYGPMLHLLTLLVEIKGSGLDDFTSRNKKQNENMAAYLPHHNSILPSPKHSPPPLYLPPSLTLL